MRNCPVCSTVERERLTSSTYRIPDGWPLPSEIIWYSCPSCGMTYGDGAFDQSMLNDYYKNYYGYGVNHEGNEDRLKDDARKIAGRGLDFEAVIVDFGGSGDNGTCTLVDELHHLGFPNATCAGPGEDIPKFKLLYASHVIEHVYDLPQTMSAIVDAMQEDAWVVVDGPDSMGIALQWKMPMLDWNTKHINHFTLRDYLNMGWRFGLEAMEFAPYSLRGAPAYQLWFKKMDVADTSINVIRSRTFSMQARLRLIDQPVNVWGLGDITWHMLSEVELDVLDFIDNDPAYRGKTYMGKPVKERPTNDAPIVIMAQGQRRLLIENIRKLGVENPIIEV